MIFKLTKDVKWVGIMDFDIKTFDIVMTTEFGTTYNSYYIEAERKTLIEVAKNKFSETYFNKLRSITDPSEIKYIILDHTEPDHSGSLGLLLNLAPEATVVGSGNAVRYLEDIINRPFNSLVVKDGDKLDLGNKTLTFISAPNLHWPDSIYTFLEEDRILFTCDSFGAHYCSYEMLSNFGLAQYASAFKYYFDVILKPYSKYLIKAIEKIKPLEINFICPGHGPVHGENLRYAIDLSEKYAKEYLKLVEVKPLRKILIAYVSAYGYTKQGAELIMTGIKETGNFDIEITDIENISFEDLESRLIACDALILGSPTINQNTLLPIYKLFAAVNPIRDKGKMAAAFGSYGWSGEAPKIILDNLRNLKFRIFEDPLGFKFSPGSDKKETLVEFGRRFGTEFLKYCQ